MSKGPFRTHGRRTAILHSGLNAPSHRLPVDSLREGVLTPSLPSLCVPQPKGWVFARDVSEIKDEKGSFTLISPARTFRLRAQTRAEHKLWLTGIRAICPDASFEGEGTTHYTSSCHYVIM